ncbi:hypothetical protein B4915_08700 [Leucobacter massiliensis]|uniref:DNA-binding protein n=1 Tax=Leucobacter massiliensis TaxID=1686285 RepID=A0A2S9QMY4_9MICO|nr:hypothetical protein B4915_08700 [Leucobacter massiliensis]
MSAVVSALPTSRSTPKREPVWLSPDKVCERVPGLTVRNLEELRAKGRGPRYHKPTPKTVIYEQGDVDAWVEASAVSTRDSD